ncbi:MAG: hypothetical protein JSW00_14890 [Thermoplasmata archaeon]|nr:MAG: hypothetical protein JSW00_14890 [Thermoplasmata archaeon]
MKKLISNIVFTKNRPLQLDAYLESLYRYFGSEIIQTYILYKVELFEEQYEQLFRRFPDCKVIKESDFSGDFLRLLKNVSTKYILFGIDDVVYFDSVDFNVIEETFNRFSKDVFGFSLRFSHQSIKAGGDRISETTAAGQTVYNINWTKGRTPTTRYPFELCATIYPAALVKRVINSVMNHSLLIRNLFLPSSMLIRALGKVISTRSILKSFGYFFSPNTLESWNCRWCQNHSGQLPSFLYFQKLCASALQVNMVNISVRKAFNGSDDYTVEALNEKYKQGYRLDIDFVANNRAADTHCGWENFRLR